MEKLIAHTHAQHIRIIFLYKIVDFLDTFVSLTNDDYLIKIFFFFYIFLLERRDDLFHTDAS